MLESDPCAIFAHGKYAALYNCRLCDFIVATKLWELWQQNGSNRNRLV